MSVFFFKDGKCFKWVICRCITRNGVKHCKPNGKAYKFPVEVPCSSSLDHEQDSCE